MIFWNNAEWSEESINQLRDQYDDEDEEDDVQEDNIVPASGASDSAAVAPLPEPHCETTASSNAVAPPVG